MKKLFVLTVIIILLQIVELSALSLYVLDPRIPVSPKQKASIEDLKVTVKPQGLYTEYGVYFTFSDSCPTGQKYFKPYDTLEIVMDFELPKEAIVNDMWLLMNSGIWVKAVLIDRWTARLIYETTVHRAWDPSLLLKNGQGLYELRVFPLAEGHTRQVKINYMLPNTWQSGQVSSPLPFDFLKSSSKQCKKISLITYPNSQFSAPAIPGHPEITFTDGTSSGFPGAMKADITNEQITLLGQVTLQYNDDMKKPFASISKYSDKSYYQLRFPTSIDFDNIKSKKICIIIDHENGKTTIDFNSVLSGLKTNLIGKLLPKDSINIVYNNGSQNVIVSENWIPSDSVSIEEAFGKIKLDPITSKSRLDTLIYSSVELMNKQNDSGMVLIVANSDAFGDRNSGNNIINTIQRRLINEVSFSIVSYLNANWKTYYIANIAYAGNDYLYSNLSRLTRGTFNKLADNPNIIKQISYNIDSSFGQFENFTINISAENGFVYNTFTYNSTGSSNNDNILTQSGILYGDIPLTIDLSYQFRKEVYFKKIKLQNSDFAKELYNNKQIFGGKYLYNFETENQDYNKISDIVQASLDYKVLSIYTGFLCVDVEPQSEQDTSTSPTDVNNIVSINGITISVNPMPVQNHAEIQVILKDEWEKFPFTLEIFNSYGSLVRNFGSNIISGDSDYKFSWDVTGMTGDKLSPGVYFLILRINGARIVYKIIVV